MKEKSTRRTDKSNKMNWKLMNFQHRFSFVEDSDTLEPLNQNLMKYREQNNPCYKYDFIGKTEAG